MIPTDGEGEIAAIELGSSPLVLLGAGASVEAGIPATVDMTHELVARIERMAYGSQLSPALNFVCGALVKHDTAKGESPYGGLDVERVFAAIELLAERQELEVTPFVASWDRAVDTWDRPSVPGLFDQNLDRAITQGHGGAQRVIEDLVEAMTGTGIGVTYMLLAKAMIQELRAMLAGHRKSLEYLAPLVNAARRPGGLSLATLNYDLAIEQAGEAHGVQVDTGIEGWIAERRWPEVQEDSLRLLKLHGSIDWCWDQGQNEPGQMPVRSVVRTDDPESERREPVLVFGQRGKLRAEGPFLSLLVEFEAALARASRLIVIGYSFRDPHINDIVSRWTRADQARTIVLIDPAIPERQVPGDFRSDLISHLNPSTWNFQTDAPNRIQLRKERASEALAQLSP